MFPAVASAAACYALAVLYGGLGTPSVGYRGLMEFGLLVPQGPSIYNRAASMENGTQ